MIYELHTAKAEGQQHPADWTTISFSKLARVNLPNGHSSVSCNVHDGQEVALPAL